MSIHETESPPPAPPPPAQKFLDGFIKILPVLQWALMVSIGVGGVFLFYRDGQTGQAAQIYTLQSEIKQMQARQVELKTARDKQIDELRAELVTKQNLQDKFETLLKLQELTREDLKAMREEMQRNRMIYGK